MQRRDRFVVTGLAVAVALIGLLWGLQRQRSNPSLETPPDSRQDGGDAPTQEQERGVGGSAASSSSLGGEREEVLLDERPASTVFRDGASPLTVRVFSPAGQPVGGAHVHLFPGELEVPNDPALFDRAQLASRDVAHRSTGVDGAATWESGIVAGTLVVVRATGYPDCGGTITPEEVVSGVSDFFLSSPGVITIRVIDGLTGAPIGGARVTATTSAPRDSVEKGALESKLAQLTAVRGTTDSEGRLQLQNIAANQEKIWIQAGGYPVRGVTPVSHGELEQLIRLYGGERATGIVVDAEGNPVEGALVVAVVIGTYPTQEVCHESTDADGRFVALEIPATSLAWVIRKTGYGTCHRYELEPLAGRNLEFVLPEGMKCAGFVVDDLDRPIPGARMELYDSEHQLIVGNYETHGDGSFDMPWVRRRSTLNILAWADGHARRRLDGVVPGPEMRIAIPRNGRVVGRVMDDAGQPITKFRVAVRRLDLDPVEDSDFFEGNEWQDAAAADGSFSVDGIPSGPVEVVVSAPGRGRVPPRRVSVPSGAASAPVHFELPAGRSISGRVVDASGAPIGGATVASLVDSLFGEPAGRTTPITSGTDNDGRFTLQGLPSSPFTLRVTDNVHPNLFLRDQRVENYPRDICFTATSIIEGQVRMPWSSPETALWVAGRRRDTLTFSAIEIDAEGRFRWGPLPPGEWQIELIDEWTDRRTGGSSVRHIAIVDLAPGETHHVEFDVERPGRILGRVRADLRREVLLRFELRLFPLDESGNAGSLAARADCRNDGSFGFSSVAFGKYLLQLGSRSRGIGSAVEEELSVTPAAPDVTIELALPEPRLTGRVLDGDQRPIIADVRLERVDLAGRGFLAKTDLDGNYAVAVPDDGTYRLIVSAPGFAEERGDPFESDSADLSEPREHVLEPEARLDLQVRDDGGASLTWIDLELHEARTEGRLVWRGRSGTDGRAEATRLPAGRFLLRAVHADWPGLAPQPIDLDWGETGRHTVTLTRLGSATITLVDAAGQSVADVALVLRRGDDPASERHATSGPDGTIRFERLLAGAWNVLGDRLTPTPVEIAPGREASAIVTVDGPR